METVAIVGVGLLGGSLAKAFRKHGLAKTILGVSSGPRPYPKEFTAQASFESAVGRADLVVLCSPVLNIIQDLKRIDRYLKPGALVTDVGSTKRAIVAAARQHVKRGVFLGGHPMAGKQVTGLEHAVDDLYKGRTWFIVRTGGPDPPCVAKFLSWLKVLEARPVELSAEEHDRTVAATSHVPQMISTLLGAALSGLIPPDQAAAKSGQGLRDMLRLSESGWSMWGDILATNSDNIEAGLKIFAAELKQFIESRHYWTQDGAAAGIPGGSFTRANAFMREFLKEQESGR